MFTLTVTRQHIFWLPGFSLQESSALLTLTTVSGHCVLCFIACSFTLLDKPRNHSFLQAPIWSCNKEKKMKKCKSPFLPHVAEIWSMIQEKRYILFPQVNQNATPIAKQWNMSESYFLWLHFISLHKKVVLTFNSWPKVRNVKTETFNLKKAKVTSDLQFLFSNLIKKRKCSNTWILIYSSMECATQH